jgi:hypothetical protein
MSFSERIASDIVAALRGVTAAGKLYIIVTEKVSKPGDIGIYLSACFAIQTPKKHGCRDT